MTKRSHIRFKPAIKYEWVLAGIILAVAVAVRIAVVPVSRPLSQASRKAVARTSITLTMGAVAATQRDIQYCGTHSQDQQLDLYRPKSQSQTAPLVVFIHGGGWSVGNKADPIVSTYGPAIVKQGDVLASLNYRLAPHSTYPDQDRDVDCALSYLYHHASDYHLDKSRIALFGASAGGQLAAYAALATPEQSRPWRSSLRGVIDFYGVSDLTVNMPQPFLAASVQRFLGPDGLARAATASPATYAANPAPPFLLFHGANDRRVPLAQSQELAQDLQTHGNTATLVVVQHAGHGFSWGSRPTVSQIRQQLTGFLAHVFNQST